MSRPLRIEFENSCYHVTSRGNARKTIFRTKSDRHQYLDYLLKAKSKYRFRLYAYVLMTNHYHLVLETPLPNLSKIMQSLNSSYANYFSRRHRQIGHIFQGRYKALLIEKDTYLLELIRYVHLNPIRAGMVDNLSEYPWSSLGEYMRADKALVDIEDILPLFGSRKRAAQKALISFLNEKREYTESEMEWLNKPFGGYIAGNVKFIKGILNKLADELIDEDIARGREMINSESLVENIIELTADEFGVGKQVLLSSVKRRIPGRDVAIYLIKANTGLRNVQIGKIFGSISYSAVSHASSRVVKEKKKDKSLRKKIEKINSQIKV